MSRRKSLPVKCGEVVSRLEYLEILPVNMVGNIIRTEAFFIILHAHTCAVDVIHPDASVAACTTTLIHICVYFIHQCACKLTRQRVPNDRYPSALHCLTQSLHTEVFLGPSACRASVEIVHGRWGRGAMPFMVDCPTKEVFPFVSHTFSVRHPLSFIRKTVQGFLDLRPFAVSDFSSEVLPSRSTKTGCPQQKQYLHKSHHGELWANHMIDYVHGLVYLTVWYSVI